MIPRKTPLARGGRIAKKRRKPSEFARIYGSKARVEWVKSLPCAVKQLGAMHRGPIENAHTKTGGMGRKADAETIVPLCQHHHRLLHDIGRNDFERNWWINLAAEADAVEKVWRMVAA